jgi:4-hydroxybutyryl-CoA dehydratase/vinylacetyl-CoA-Delta-isomerase
MTWHLDQERGAGRHQRFLDYMHWVQDEDLSTAIAMTDGKGDRSQRPHEQRVPDSYVHVTERRPGGIVIRGTKAIVTGAPYMHEILVLPCRNMTAADRDFAVACAVPIDAPGVTISARPAGRPGEKSALFSGRYGQSLGVIFFDNVFVPDSRVFLDGEWSFSGPLTRSYATHHRHTCIGARAGFGDLLIGAGTMTMHANGLTPETAPHLRDRMVDLIKIVEGIFACGIAASVYGLCDPAGNIEPEPVYSNIGKLLLATQIYDMHRIAHEVSGGMIVSLPGPDEDHNPATAASIADTLRGHPDVPYAHRAKLARFVEDLTISSTAGWYSTISLHGGGSPEAMKLEIFRNYPIQDKVALVDRLLGRGLLPGRTDAEGQELAPTDQAGRCCPQGCRAPELPLSLRKNRRS